MEHSQDILEKNRNNEYFDTRLTKGLNVLSWDCGTTNLSYCFMEYVNKPEKEFEIIFWENINLNSKNMKEAVDSLVPELTTRPWMLKTDYVCIEEQVMDNPSMKIIAHSLQMYFVTNASGYKVNSRKRFRQVFRGRPRVFFVPPKDKFKAGIIPDVKWTGAKRKTKVIAEKMTHQILIEKNHELALEYLKTHKKIDDLCDSFLQGLVFLRRVHARNKQKQSIERYLEIEDQSAHVEIFGNKKTEQELPFPQFYSATGWKPPLNKIEDVAQKPISKHLKNPDSFVH
jgi:hypothetical protein